MSQLYSEKLKESIVKKITLPGGPSVKDTAVKIGVSDKTIYRWIASYASNSSMKKSKADLSPEEKLIIIVKTFSMPENELGEFLRENGLHSADIDQWKQDFYSATKAPGRPRIDPEVVMLRNKEKELSKNLHRKDRALAEMSARVILLKKSHAIFGEPEDEE